MRPDAAASDGGTDAGPERRRAALARMSERKFTRGLGKPGMAAQLRETVSQVVRESTVQVRTDLRVSDVLSKSRAPSAGIIRYALTHASTSVNNRSFCHYSMSWNSASRDCLSKSAFRGSKVF